MINDICLRTCLPLSGKWRYKITAGWFNFFYKIVIMVGYIQVAGAVYRNADRAVKAKAQGDRAAAACR